MITNMKSNIYINLFVLALSMASICCMYSCKEEFKSPKESELPLISDFEKDITVEVDQKTNNVNFSFKGKGAMPVWIIDGKQYSTLQSFTKYYRKAGDYSVDVRISNYNGVSDAFVTIKFHIDKTIMNGFGGYVYDTEFNMWRNAEIKNPTFYYAPNWNKIADPSYTKIDGGYNINLSEATKEQWQAQMLINTDIKTVSSSNYDFSVILTSTTDHPGVTVKLVDPKDAEIYYFAEKVVLKANEPICFWKNNIKGKDISDLQIVFDFGGNVANSDISIENVVLKDHNNDDGTILPKIDKTPDPAWVDVESNDNLWKNMSFDTSFYYAPKWQQIANPKMNIDGHSYSLNFPEATFEQWQNQIIMTTKNLSLSPNQYYDFKVEINSSKGIRSATVKLAQADNDDVFLFMKNVELPPNEDIVVKVINAKGVDITKGKLVFDFGGNPSSTDVRIKNIILQTHRE